MRKMLLFVLTLGKTHVRESFTCVMLAPQRTERAKKLFESCQECLGLKRSQLYHYAERLTAETVESDWLRHLYRLWEAASLVRRN